LEGRRSYTAGAWATGNNMNTARFQLGGAGTQTAALALVVMLIHLTQMQQKNMMEQVGQESRFKYCKS
jgi:hypothetical protein